MSIVAFVPVEHMAAANTTLESAGHGPGNFSVPLRTEGGAGGTRAGLHCWKNPAFLAALQPIPEVEIFQSDDIEAAEHFRSRVTAKALEWSDPARWFDNPVMTGDQRQHGGKTWRSLIDFNVWEPPVGWREVVAEGHPAWVAPTGAHDAYPMGARVTHSGSDWENTGSDANVWEPGVFGWVVIRP